MLVIGDGVVGALDPSRHVHRWRDGPAPWKRLMHGFLHRPGLTRALALAEVAAGAWYAHRLPPRP